VNDILFAVKLAQMVAVYINVSARQIKITLLSVLPRYTAQSAKPMSFDRFIFLRIIVVSILTALTKNRQSDTMVYNYRFVLLLKVGFSWTKLLFMKD